MSIFEKSYKKKCIVVHCKKDKYDVYCGRPSKWGNPFTHINDGNTLAKYVCVSRKSAIENYRIWLLEGEGQYLLKDLHELEGKILGCFCVPKKCHCEILAELVNKL